MTRHLVKATAVVALGVLFFVHRAAFTDEGDKGGTIEGTVDNSLIRSDPAVVYLKEVKGDFPPPKEHAKMDQTKLTFTPKVLPVLVGTTVDCPNSDNVQHNIFSPTKSTKPFNLGLYPPGQSKDIVLNKPGVVPLLCNVHAEMSAFIVVLPNPYFAKTEKDGSFKIGNVPPGKYKLAIWHEKLKAKTIDVTVKAGSTESVKFGDLEKGKYSVDLVK